MIVVDDVTAGYRTRRGLVKALDRVSFTVGDSEMLGIAGESGCGKTTLLKLLYGRFDDGLELLSGQVYWQDPDGGERVDVRDFHRHWWRLFSYVPQGSMSTLNPLMRVGPQMLDAGQATRGREPDRSARVRSVLDELDLPERTLTSFPHELSGGMRQRVAIARTLLCGRELLALDEPFAALDALTRRELQGWLQAALGLEPRSVVLVTHDAEEAAVLADRVVVMAGRPGRVRSELTVGLPRPRRAGQPEIVALRERALAALATEPPPL